MLRYRSYDSYLSTPISILLALKDGWIYRYMYRYFHPWVDAGGVTTSRTLNNMWRGDDFADWIEDFSHPSSASSYTLGRTLLGKNSKRFWSSLWIVFAYVSITNVDVVLMILKLKISSSLITSLIPSCLKLISDISLSCFGWYLIEPFVF